MNIKQQNKCVVDIQNINGCNKPFYGLPNVYLIIFSHYDVVNMCYVSSTYFRVQSSVNYNLKQKQFSLDFICYLPT